MTQNFQIKFIFIFRLIVSNRVESEKQELILALDEANSSLDEEQNKTRRANNETAQARHEMDKLSKEKEDEIDNLKKGHQKIIETLQVSFN